MPTRRLRWRGFGIEVEVPDRAVRTMRGLIGERKPHRAHDAPDDLELADTVPALRLEHPDQARERFMRELHATLELYPDGWSGPPPAADEELAEQIRRLPWYHTLELPGGVVTPGFYDHRPLVPHYGIPRDLSGKRVLDVGTWDGFWAFEFERRGAEVVAVDIDRMSQTDLPPQLRAAALEAGLDQRLGNGFEIARRAMDSKVQRIGMSVYDIDTGGIGTFDLVHMADVAIHLERPLEAFRRLRSVARGSAIIVDAFHPDLGYGAERKVTEYRGGWKDVQWWIPSLDTLAQMVLDAGFGDVRVHRIYRLDLRGRPGSGQWRAILVANA